MDTYYNLARKRVLMAIKDNPCTFEELCRKCRGLYPTMINEILEDLKIEKYHIPVYALNRTIGSINQCGEHNKYCDMVTDTVQNNPVLSSWYYSWDTCYKLGNLSLWKNKHILFLGSPRLFEYFASKGLGERLVLVDLDSVVIDALSQRYTTDTSEKVFSFFRGDINDFSISKFLEEHPLSFDSVFLDPPWYLECYTPWLNTALKLIKPGGYVIFSLFPSLLRPTAISERTEILTKCREIAKTVLLCSDLSEYDTPSFERKELEHVGLALRHNWKISDVVVLTDITKNTFSQNISITKDYLSWKEFDWLNMRWFLDYSRNFSHNPHFLSAPQGSRFLKSPSKRNPQFNEVNLLSSRGHGLCVSDPVKFMSLISKLRCKDRKPYSYHKTIASFDIDQSSKELLYDLSGDS